VFRDREPVALIDFDLVAPSSPVWEVGCAVRHWIPLRGEGPEGPDAAPAVTAAKLRAFALAYGLVAADRARLLDAVLDAEDLQLALLRRWVEEGSEVYRQIWAAGAPDRIGQRVEWITRHRSTLAAALA
jgi:hypothetical protein